MWCMMHHFGATRRCTGVRFWPAGFAGEIPIAWTRFHRPQTKTAAGRVPDAVILMVVVRSTAVTGAA